MTSCWLSNNLRREGNRKVLSATKKAKIRFTSEQDPSPTNKKSISRNKTIAISMRWTNLKGVARCLYIYMFFLKILWSASLVCWHRKQEEEDKDDRLRGQDFAAGQDTDNIRFFCLQSTHSLVHSQRKQPRHTRLICNTEKWFKDNKRRNRPHWRQQTRRHVPNRPKHFFCSSLSPLIEFIIFFLLSPMQSRNRPTKKNETTFSK